MGCHHDWGVGDLFRQGGEGMCVLSGKCVWETRALARCRGMIGVGFSCLRLP